MHSFSIPIDTNFPLPSPRISKMKLPSVQHFSSRFKSSFAPTVGQEVLAYCPSHGAYPYLRAISHTCCASTRAMALRSRQVNSSWPAQGRQQLAIQYLGSMLSPGTSVISATVASWSIRTRLVACVSSNVLVATQYVRTRKARLRVGRFRFSASLG